MEANELKQIMEEADKKHGNFPDTQKEKYKMKRIKRLASFTEVTHKVIETLEKWGIPFTLCEVLHSNKQKQRITTDIFIPYANIVIRQVDMNSNVEVSKMRVFYESFKAAYYPFFIRSSETEEFVLQKLQMCIMKANDFPKNGFNGVSQKKPKRPRIKGRVAVKVGR